MSQNYRSYHVIVVHLIMHFVPIHFNDVSLKCY